MQAADANHTSKRATFVCEFCVCVCAIVCDKRALGSDNWSAFGRISRRMQHYSLRPKSHATLALGDLAAAAAGKLIAHSSPAVAAAAVVAPASLWAPFLPLLFSHTHTDKSISHVALVVGLLQVLYTFTHTNIYTHTHNARTAAAAAAGVELKAKVSHAERTSCCCCCCCFVRTHLALSSNSTK